MRQTHIDPVAAQRHGSAANAWFRACRPHHWLKNMTVLAPVFAGHVYGEPQKMLVALLAFALMCALSSAGYVLNDIMDLDTDRRHPTKGRRPFASGELNTLAGAAVALSVIVVVFGVATFLPLWFFLLLCVYAALMLAYTFRIKRIPLIDVATIATLFTLRVAIGAAAADLAQSAWLLSFAWALFLSLSFAKRHCEIMHAAQSGRGDIAARGYETQDWPLTLAFGVAAGLASIVINLIYLANDVAPSGFYRNQTPLYVIPAVVLLWLMRIWLFSHRTRLDDDPVLFAIRDRASIVLAATALIAFIAAL